MAAYATPEDVYLLAVPRGSLVQRARPVASVDHVANVLELEGHGCSSKTRVQVQVDLDGVPPGGLSTSTVYWALPVAQSSSLLQLSLTEGGAPVDLLDAGVMPFGLFVPVTTMLEAALSAASRDVDTMLPAHAVPLAAPYPEQVVNYVAVFAGWATARALGQGDLADGLQALKDEWTTKALRWARGIPLRNQLATSPTNLARGRSPSIDGDEVIA